MDLSDLNSAEMQRFYSVSSISSPSYD